MSSTLSQSCIYTIRHKESLDAEFVSGGSGEFIERGRWKKGSEILQVATKEHQRVPILFAPANADITDGIIYWALIEDITLAEKTTTVRFSALKPLSKKHRLSSLMKLSDNAPLSDNYIRPYVPCFTPQFVVSASRVAAPTDFSEIEIEEISAREGGSSMRFHLHRERDRKIISRKRRQVLAATGRLACSVCGFDFQEFYGDIGSEFCEVHHLRPLSDADGEVQTRLEDLAVVCSNCHRMIHRSQPFLTIEQLKSIIKHA